MHNQKRKNNYHPNKGQPLGCRTMTHTSRPTRIMSPLCTQRWGHITLPLSAHSVSVCLPLISYHCFLSSRRSNTIGVSLHTALVNDLCLLSISIFHNKLSYPRARSATPCFIEHSVQLFKIVRYLDCRASQDRPIRQRLTAA